uniref:Bone morphogenetic protein 7-like n=1 Tax=Gouania willdenowi TaxID=441366 RepID=A0A8C5EIF0_GOUWI
LVSLLFAFSALLLILWWLSYSCVLSVRVAVSNFSVEAEVQSSFLQGRLRSQERRDIQREILSILGLPHRPRPYLGSKQSAAPVFMLDLYNIISTDAQLPGYPYYRAPMVTPMDSRFLDDADTVMSFTNLVDQDRDLLVRQQAREFRFDLSRIPEGEAITAAELRICKDFIHEHNDNETFRVLVYQILQKPLNKLFSPLMLLGQRTVWASEDGWLVFDLTTASNLWLVKPEQNLGLHLLVEDSHGSRSPELSGLVTGSGPRNKQPFLVVFFKANEVRLRSIRSAHGQKRRHSKHSKPQRTSQDVMKAVESAAGGCNRRELYVSFKDLGWQDWIIAPEGYSAYYCEGECAFPLNSYMNATNHAIVQTLVHFINPDLVPKPCCAPTQLHGISVLYFDDSSNVILKKYRNMVVRACGCH